MRPVLLLLFGLAILSGLYLTASDTAFATLFTSPEELVAMLRQQGPYGAIIIIGLMSTAVVLNPLPSAPVALASGAVFGHTWGTVYIVLGAQIGATIAFIIARLTGRNVVERLLGGKAFPDWIGTQNAMTLAVLVARLVPFVSFDLASYGAGLTPLKLWRFSVATFIGLLPASFLLAHFGSELTEADPGLILTISAGLGLAVLLSVTFAWWRAR
jgi:uncharacterized membrane protein YdjX (TVP38/TMEM64 family)